MGKIISRTDLKEVVESLKKKNKKIVTTNGSFDLLHAGHIKSLKFAKEQGDVVIVGLNTDSSIKKYKSEKRPIIPEKQRTEILSAIMYVDYIVLFDEKTPNELLKEIQPDVHVKGSEYEENIPEKKIVEKYGGKVVFVERDEKEVSSTNIINRILSLGQ